MSLVVAMDIEEIKLEGDKIDDKSYEIWLNDLHQMLQTEEEIILKSQDQTNILNTYYNYYYYLLCDLVLKFSYEYDFKKYVEKINKVIRKLKGLIFCESYVDKKKIYN